MADVDPLEERRVDGRDLQPVPSGFSPGLGRSTMMPPDEVVPGLALGQLYWLYGSAPQGRPPCAVTDPPCSGWGTVLVLDETGISRRVFHSSQLKSWVLPNDCYEMLSLQHVSAGASHPGWQAEMRDKLVERIRHNYAASKLRGWTDPDYETADRVLRMLGSSAPAERDWQRLAPAAKRSDRPGAEAEATAVQQRQESKTPKASAFKPVKADSRKGQVLKFFADGGSSADKAQAELGIQRNNLLSQLFLLRKDHGIEYKVSGDSVQLVLPEGQELFA